MVFFISCVLRTTDQLSASGHHPELTGTLVHLDNCHPSQDNEFGAVNLSLSCFMEFFAVCGGVLWCSYRYIWVHCVGVFCGVPSGMCGCFMVFLPVYVGPLCWGCFIVFLLVCGGVFSGVCVHYVGCLVVFLLVYMGPLCGGVLWCPFRYVWVFYGVLTGICGSFVWGCFVVFLLVCGGVFSGVCVHSVGVFSGVLTGICGSIVLGCFVVSLSVYVGPLCGVCFVVSLPVCVYSVWGCFMV